MISPVLIDLALRFGVLSLFAIGGVNAIVTEIQRVAVDVEGWVTRAEFAQAFAIAAAAPGPNLLVVSLIGWKVQGLAGALVATIAICAPSSVVTYAVAHYWNRFRDAPLRVAIERALAPITVGLVLSSGFILARTVDEGLAAVALTVATTALAFTTRVHPLWLLGAGAALGAAGVV
jgi:chromate transporter